MTKIMTKISKVVSKVVSSEFICMYVCKRHTQREFILYICMLYLYIYVKEIEFIIYVGVCKRHREFILCV